MQYMYCIDRRWRSGVRRQQRALVEERLKGQAAVEVDTWSHRHYQDEHAAFSWYLAAAAAASLRATAAI